MRIRQVAPADLELAVELAEAAFGEGDYYRAMTFNRQKARAITFEVCAEVNPGGFLALTDDGEPIGMIAGRVAPHWCADELIACDYTLYVRPAHRGSFAAIRLVRRFEQWAKERGAVRILLGVSNGDTPERTLRLYERLGYRLFGVATVKDL